jgi:hypothetical protein
VYNDLKESWDDWFEDDSSMESMVADLVAKRVLISVSDALFCYEFIKLLVKENVPGFDFEKFMDSWTALLPQLVTCSSEGEVKIFGEFVYAMMKFVVDMRFSRDDDAEFKSQHAAWESNLCSSIIRGLSEEADWCERRNCLILISRACETCPMIEANAIALKQAVEEVAAHSQHDIATLAMSLVRKISSLENQWLERTSKPAEVKPVIQESQKQDETMEEPISDHEEKPKGRVLVRRQPEVKKSEEVVRQPVKRLVRDEHSEYGSKRPRDDRYDRPDRDNDRRNMRNHETGALQRRDRGMISRR